MPDIVVVFTTARPTLSYSRPVFRLQEASELVSDAVYAKEKQMRLLNAVPLFLTLVSPALADGEILRLITDADKARLEKFDDTRAAALARARNGGNAADATVLETLVDQSSLPFAGFDMVGNWQCRTIELGGPATLVVYDWFRCRVSDDGAGWMLEKLSGSQRTKGRFFTESDNRLTYLGAYFVAGETPPAYGAGPETDQAGYAYRTGESAWRIEFPLPARESELDILEFQRTTSYL